MKIDVLTLFPEMFAGVFGSSILGKAADKGIVELNAVNFRTYSTSKHGTVDDTPYGGGGGMVLKPDPIFAAVEDLLAQKQLSSDVSGEQASVSSPVDSSVSSDAKPRIILMCPQGETFTQQKAEELSREQHLIFICGHYEGYDERIREHLVTDELSIGDYVLTGGEIPAMTVVDSVVRLLPGVLGNESSAVTDSFSTGLLEYPHYTRPAEFRGMKVPDVLLSGHHANVEKWRREQSLLRTLQRRPDLLEQAELTAAERRWLALQNNQSETAE
ncbi:tRNA (guanosine(37)-N1)-methyltransferase TrmD [Paenibacillus bovis]|uniref:tRNA (guanine-N(1)-)-methyltransferase n=1 Tax=Paenibacillus bovis TaxID=1616788 RepID=A0A172ZNH4_9BACL|nr:tRNA (guanosine(37)-N1)-methyltransferase TrmD [Paenibacillus bovis]ANF98760.1 tRNA (guanosine(37)-N1)-methyltransferase TrmD [Paenibacillus bovis]